MGGGVAETLVVETCALGPGAPASRSGDGRESGDLGWFCTVLATFAIRGRIMGPRASRFS